MNAVMDCCKVSNVRDEALPLQKPDSPPPTGPVAQELLKVRSSRSRVLRASVDLVWLACLLGRWVGGLRPEVVRARWHKS